MASVLIKIVRVCNAQFKCTYLKNKLFFIILPLLLESTSNSKHFEAKDYLIGHGFPKLQTLKNLLGPCSKNRRFRTRFASQEVKAS